MIATLSGIVSEKLIDQAIIEAQGVGYGVLTTDEDNRALVLGERAKLYIYEHIREVSYDLFGFIRQETKLFFEQLLEVNGVGPRMALSILNIGAVAEVKQSIASADTRFIQRANGVGKRIAERIVVELKDKVGLPSSDLESTGILNSESMTNQDDAALALVSLGYSLYDATEALKYIDKDLQTEERVRLALVGVKK
jgi:Holliday junction DNA helicase RuvA